VHELILEMVTREELTKPVLDTGADSLRTR
jgi:hypothetical protein